MKILRKEGFKNLKVSIERLPHKNSQPKLKCTYNWNCKNEVCRFDHSYLNCKINYFQENQFQRISAPSSTKICNLKLKHVFNLAPKTWKEFQGICKSEDLYNGKEIVFGFAFQLFCKSHNE